MATVEQISTRALKRLGIPGEGGTLSASEMADAIEALNAMIEAWECDWLSGDTLPLAARFEQGVVAMLAVRLAGDYGVSVNDVLVRDAQRGEQQIQSAFFTVPASRFEGPLKNNGTNVAYAVITTDTENYDPWQSETEYTVRKYATLDGNVYECVTAGTSGTTGPSGTASEITDGTVTWCWRRAIGAL
jgi:hypothetical protein